MHFFVFQIAFPSRQILILQTDRTHHWYFTAGCHLLSNFCGNNYSKALTWQLVKVHSIYVIYSIIFTFMFDTKESTFRPEMLQFLKQIDYQWISILQDNQDMTVHYQFRIWISQQNKLILEQQRRRKNMEKAK